MGLATLILHYAGDERKRSAVVAACGIDDVESVEAAERFLRRDLCGIDGGRRFVDLNGLPQLLLVKHGHFYRGPGIDLHARPIDRIKPLFLYAQVVRSGSEVREQAVADEVGFTMYCVRCR